jgi:hypothetical protein
MTSFGLLGFVQLGAAREVAQIGAVLGRDFAYALLRDVAELDEPTLQAVETRSERLLQRWWNGLNAALLAAFKKETGHLLYE